jgi:hypothetical protein
MVLKKRFACALVPFTSIFYWLLIDLPALALSFAQLKLSVEWPAFHHAA